MLRSSIVWILAALAFVAAHGGSLTADGQLTVEEIRRLLGSQTSQEDIARLVKEADALVVTEADVAALQAAGADEPLLEALRRRLGRSETFSVDAVLRLLAAGTPSAEVVDRILAEGQRFALTASEKLALVRRGVGDDVLRALEGGYVYPGFARYVPENRLYEIQHPTAWRASTFFTSEGMRVVLSPQSGMKNADDFSLGVQIDVSPLDAGSGEARRGELEELVRSLPALLRGNQAFALETVSGEAGTPRALRVAGEDGATVDFLATMRGTRCHDRLVLVNVDGVKFDVELIAPVAEQAALKETFAGILRTFRPYPDRVRLQRRAEALDAAAAVDRFRSAVVQVATYENGELVGTGSGFLVRSDGYVLTNHHVVCGRDNHSGCRSPADMQLVQSIEVVWDKAVAGKGAGQRQRRLPATLVDTVYVRHPYADLALLKIPSDGGPYPTLPMGRIGRLSRTGLVAGGDPVIAMGFPLGNVFTPDEVMSTTGVVARLVTKETLLGTGGRAEQLDHVVTTAQIRPGNSGGPCISLRTGAVVGLNTSSPIYKGEALPYYSICPIDEALYAFPQLTFYPLGSELGPEAHSDLAAMLLVAGNTRSAGVELHLANAKAASLAPRAQASLLYREATYHTRRRDDEQAMKALLACLERDPTHSGALIDLAYSQDGEHVEAALGYADRLVRAYDDNWWSYLQRGEVRRRAKRLDAALEDVQAAVERGGSFDPGLHRLLGRIRVDMGECPAATAAYREAIARDAADWEAKLGLAACAAHSGALVEATSRFETAVGEHPDEPAVREAYGRHLLVQPGHEKAALEQLVEAVVLTLGREAPPDPALLDDLAEAALAQSDLPTARRSAALLHEHWFGWRASTHRLFARLWPEAGHEALVRAHLAAAEVLEPSDAGGAGSLRVSPLATTDLTEAISAHYGGALLSEVLDVSALGFDFAIDPEALTDRSREIVRNLGWDAWHVDLIHARYLRDQLQGGRALGDLVEVAWVGGVDVQQDPATAALQLTNAGKVGLTRLRVRIGYLPETGDEPLGALEIDVPSSTIVLPPDGAVITIPIRLHTAAEQRAQGIDPAKVEHYTVRLLSARNATYLKGLEVSTADAGENDSEVTVTNKSRFAVLDVVVRCALVDGKAPILDASGKALERFSVFEGVRIEPGESVKTTLTGWRSAEGWQALGLAEGLTPGMVFSVVGGEAAERAATGEVR